jgi:signal transduction histidine kinase
VIEEILESMAGTDRSIFQIDVFHQDRDGGLKLISSGDETAMEIGPEIQSLLSLPGPRTELVGLTTGNRAWKVYLPISNPRPGRPPLGLIRAYCDLERWEDVWEKNYRATYRTLPWVLMGEFILLWVLLALLVKDPMQALVETMERLEQGDASARAKVRKDEIGMLAQRFNLMAAELQRAGEERESLIHEIRALNTGLQERIDLALAELQDKNLKLEQQVERNALLREELSQQERLAVAGQLTATFAHEVGTPLNLVHGHLQLIQGQGDLPEKARERLGVIQAQIQRVGDIVRRLLDVTRRPQLNQEAVSLRVLVEDLQKLWTPTLAAHRVRFELDAPEDCVLFVDRKQMEQLFINLVNNAVDAMPSGGSIRLEATTDGAGWDLALKDEGLGIAPEHLGQIFKPMFTTKPEGKGTGLGLPICREIVRSHGGEIRAASVPGMGTTLHFHLPGFKAPPPQPDPEARPESVAQLP